MLIPWRSDVDIDRQPWVTIGLIAANLIAFVLMRVGPVSDGEIREALRTDFALTIEEAELRWEDESREAAAAGEIVRSAPTSEDLRRQVEDDLRAVVARLDEDERELVADQVRMQAWAMPHGVGLTPLRWFTSAFSHANFLHFAGNMLFLWVFGVIVESRMRPGSFVALYFGLTAAIGVLQQVLLDEPGQWSLGASSSISALMAMAGMWVPRTRVECLFIFLISVRTVEIPVWGMCLLYIGVDIVISSLIGWQLSTSMLHATGAGIGLIFALTAIQMRWLAKADSMPTRPRGKARAAILAVPAVDPTAGVALAEMRRRLAAGDAAGAAALHGHTEATKGAWHLLPEDRDRLIDALFASGRPTAARLHLDRAVQGGGAALARYRLRLAALQLPRSPEAALADLEAVDHAELEPADRAWRAYAMTHARTLIAGSTAGTVSIAKPPVTRTLRARVSRGEEPTRPEPTTSALRAAMRPPPPLSTSAAAILSPHSLALAPSPSPAPLPEKATVRVAIAPSPPPRYDANGLPIISDHVPQAPGLAPLSEAGPFATIDDLIRQGRWHDARTALTQRIAVAGDDNAARLRQARIALAGDGLPAKALRLLEAISPVGLHPQDQRLREDLLAEARRQRAGSTARHTG